MTIYDAYQHALCEAALEEVQVERDGYRHVLATIALSDLELEPPTASALRARAWAAIARRKEAA